MDKVDATKTQITSVTIIGRKNNDEHTFKTGEEINLSIKYKNPKKVPTHFGFQIFNEAGVYCFGANTLIDGRKTESAASGSIDFSFAADLLPGSYYITVAAMNDTATVVHSYKTRAVSFRINKDTQLEGIAMLPHKWS